MLTSNWSLSLLGLMMSEYLVATDWSGLDWRPVTACVRAHYTSHHAHSSSKYHHPPSPWYLLHCLRFILLASSANIFRLFWNKSTSKLWLLAPVVWWWTLSYLVTTTTTGHRTGPPPHCVYLCYHHHRHSSVVDLPLTHYHHLLTFHDHAGFVIWYYWCNLTFCMILTQIPSCHHLSLIFLKEYFDFGLFSHV